jgi:hypothetical protein
MRLWRPPRSWRGVAGVLGGALVGGVAALLSWTFRGRLTLDSGVGRSLHQLGPVTVLIDAPRDLVFEYLSAPYLGRARRDGAETVEVLERGADLVVARHRSKVAWWAAETVESVRFEAPARVSFRHLRGPVPHALESFELIEREGGCELTYRGELGLDFWVLGSVAARYWVVPTWLGIVETHMGEAKSMVEARAAARRRRQGRPHEH